MKAKRCKVCGKKLLLTAERRYTVQKMRSPATAILPPVFFEAFDCQHCGCQNIVGERQIENFEEVEE